MRSRTFALFLLVTLLPHLPVAGSWHSYRYDAAHTGNNPDENLDPSRLTLAWEKDLENGGGSNWSIPCIAKKKLFVGGRTEGVAYLRALTLEDGELIWERPVETWHMLGGPVVTGRRVVISLRHPGRRLEAYDSATGDLLWSSAPTWPWSPSSVGPPVVQGNRAYMHGDWYLYAFDMKDGTILWNTWIGAAFGPPAAKGGLIFGSGTGFRYGLRAWSGRTVWMDTSPVSSGGRMPAVGNHVYTRDTDWDLPNRPETIFANDPMTGELVWKRGFSSRSLSDLAVTDDALYLTDRRVLRAIDPQTGDDLWEFAGDGSLMWLPPTVAGDHLFVASEERTYAIHIPTRTVVWSTDLAGRTVVSQGWVLICANHGVVRAYHSDR